MLLVFGVSFCTISTSLCLDDIGSRAAQSVYHMLFCIMSMRKHLSLNEGDVGHHRLSGGH